MFQGPTLFILHWFVYYAVNMAVCRFHLPGNQFWRTLQRCNYFLITMPLQRHLFRRRYVRHAFVSLIVYLVRPHIQVMKIAVRYKILFTN